MQIIQCDSRQKRKHHERKEKYFKEKGYELVHSKMLVGDYCIPSNGSVSVDTKADLTELYGNLIQQHERFHNECVLAQKAGIKDSTIRNRLNRGWDIDKALSVKSRKYIKKK